MAIGSKIKTFKTIAFIRVPEVFHFEACKGVIKKFEKECINLVQGCIVNLFELFSLKKIIKGGVIIIGSLFWDSDKPERVTWWKELNFGKRIKTDLPIRYGRSSGVDRKNTYSMIFSTSYEQQAKSGKAFIVPILRDVENREEFERQVQLLALAEGFVAGRIGAKWGCVCLKVNPSTSDENKNLLSAWWRNLVNHNINTTTRTQTNPDINEFGEINEEKSITPDWLLNVSDDAFKNNNLDFLLATSNALRYRGSEAIIYPMVNEICAAMVEGKYFDYFLRNRMNHITTVDDKKIAKIVKGKYKINLKQIRKKWKPKRRVLKRLKLSFPKNQIK